MVFEKPGELFGDADRRRSLLLFVPAREVERDRNGRKKRGTGITPVPRKN
jgi:hypothetical protein